MKIDFDKYMDKYGIPLDRSLYKTPWKLQVELLKEIKERQKIKVTESLSDLIGCDEWVKYIEDGTSCSESFCYKIKHCEPEKDKTRLQCHNCENVVDVIVEGVSNDMWDNECPYCKKNHRKIFEWHLTKKQWG